MNVKDFVEILGADFWTGVPDSQLKALCNYLMAAYGIDGKHHIIAANEGNCAALAAGYHLATGKVPAVYMQNSGEGNIINPAASLLNEKVYAIPVIFVVGWRGEPGVHDEPQHIWQGEVTVKLLEDMDIAVYVVGKETTREELAEKMAAFRELLARGKDVAFVIRKGALTDAPKVVYENGFAMRREEIIRHIAAVSGDDPVVSTTGKASRELFEIREATGARKRLPHRGLHGPRLLHRPGHRPAEAGGAGLVHRRGRGGPDAHGGHGGDRGQPAGEPDPHRHQQRRPRDRGGHAHRGGPGGPDRRGEGLRLPQRRLRGQLCSPG